MLDQTAANPANQATQPPSNADQSGHGANVGGAYGSTRNGAASANGTGNGSAQTLTVYGQIAAQTTPAPGAYADTVNVTVTF